MRDRGGWVGIPLIDFRVSWWFEASAWLIMRATDMHAYKKVLIRKKSCCLLWMMSTYKRTTLLTSVRGERDCCCYITRRTRYKTIRDRQRVTQGTTMFKGRRRKSHHQQTIKEEDVHTCVHAHTCNFQLSGSQRKLYRKGKSCWWWWLCRSDYIYVCTVSVIAIVINELLINK